MTLKIRNRINLIFSALAATFLLLNIILLIYEMMNGNFNIPTPSYIRHGTTFLTSYHPRAVLLCLIFEMLYGCITFFILYNAFEKTQSSEVIFFTVFVVSILLDSTRFWIVLFDLANSFTTRAIWCQNLVLFSRILAPLSLFILTTMSEPEKRQYIEQCILIVVIVALIFGIFDPINTGELLPNFCFVYGYAKSIKIASIIICIACTIWLFFENRRKLLSNKITIGFVMICTGFFFLIDSSMPISLGLGLLFLYFGTAVYLRQLHNQYLWNY